MEQGQELLGRPDRLTRILSDKGREILHLEVKMSGEARREQSKWDAKGPPDIVEISEDESLPMNMDDHHKGGDLLSNQDFAHGNDNQIGESMNLKSAVSMHHGSTGHEQDRADGLNKDIKERCVEAAQSQSISERWLEQVPQLLEIILK
ncbi:hypothetical protein E2562_026188 [Oryza meyeriana var. granulata]|uniref:Uncharacterized protein n=1 Tax=Oryza meyeriana var. granulata TaxID=110450 RepID=A0A6G1E113_9ORYZ|nr:hypothetical protein E2562_026188 [Oryza meyeriana var. granulata]